GLAAITMRALSKRPEDRFASSGEMAAALRAERERLKAPAREALRCDSCGVDNPTGMRFCGGCGAPLGVCAPLSEPARARRSDRYSSRPADARPMVGRKELLQRIAEAREAALRGAVWLELTGEPGVGRTRLLEESAQRFADRGDLVVGAELHP